MTTGLTDDEPELPASALADQLNAIALRCSQRPVVSDLTDDEILGYDEFGIPTT